MKRQKENSSLDVATRGIEWIRRWKGIATFKQLAMCGCSIVVVHLEGARSFSQALKYFVTQ